MENEYCLIDDSVLGVGGTSLTLDAIVEPNKKNVSFRSTSEFSLTDLYGFDFFVLGNLINFSQNSLDSIKLLMEEKPFVKIEFDYGYCPYRGNIPHRILGGEECRCPEKNSHLYDVYKLIRKNAKHIFFMSENQMKIHEEHVDPIDELRKSVLSSCFTKETLLLFKKLKKKHKNNKYAIIDGQGGWHTQAKGINESIKYAESNKIEFELIKTKTHLEMLNKLSNYKGLISLPIIDDTCPRITLEARYMGLDVITNEFSQHISEKWWKGSDEEAFSFTESRPDYFWKKLKC